MQILHRWDRPGLRAPARETRHFLGEELDPELHCVAGSAHLHHSRTPDIVFIQAVQNVSEAIQVDPLLLSDNSCHLLYRHLSFPRTFTALSSTMPAVPGRSLDREVRRVFDALEAIGSCFSTHPPDWEDMVACEAKDRSDVV